MATLRHRQSATVEVEPGLFGQKLVDGAQGARGLSLVRGWMRPGGRHSPHTHDVEEAVVFLAGRGIVEIGGERFEVGPGDTLRIPANTPHGTFNPGTEDLTFVAAFDDCLIAANPLATAEDPAGGRRQANALRRGLAILLRKVAGLLSPPPRGATTPR